MRAGRVYSQADLPGGGAPSLRALRVILGPDAAALLVLHRDGADFRAADGLALSNLAPYLPAAVTNWQRLEGERARAALDRQLAGDLGAGWIVLSPAGQVLDMAPGLAGRLAGAGIRIHDGRLSPRDAGAAADLRRALAGAAEQLRIFAPAPGLHMLISAQDFAGRPALIARLRLAPFVRDLPPERLARWFGLSRSEARLAMLICDGFTLQEAAEQLGWTLETVRSCSKQIFARSGARGQPDLVRRIWSGGIWLDAGSEKRARP